MGTPRFLPYPNPSLLSLSDPPNPVVIYASEMHTGFWAAFPDCAEAGAPKAAAAAAARVSQLETAQESCQGCPRCSPRCGHCCLAWHGTHSLGTPRILSIPAAGAPCHLPGLLLQLFLEKLDKPFGARPRAQLFILQVAVGKM